jgi:hypothetical protein
MNGKSSPEIPPKTSKEDNEQSKATTPPTPQQVNDAVDKHRAAVPGKGPKNKGSIG